MYLIVTLVLYLLVPVRGAATTNKSSPAREDPEIAEENRLNSLKLNETEISAIRPLLDCHPLYNTDDKQFELGEGRRRFIYKFCMYAKGQDQDCVKRCMAEQMGILDLTSFKYDAWNDRASMTGRLRLFFQDTSYAAAATLAGHIIRECSHKVLQEPILRVACDTLPLKELFECVDPILDCASENFFVPTTERSLNAEEEAEEDEEPC